MLGNHHGGDAGVAARNRWHNRCINDAQAIYAVNAATRIDDGHGITRPAHPAGSDWMEDRGDKIEQRFRTFLDGRLADPGLNGVLQPERCIDGCRDEL